MILFHCYQITLFKNHLNIHAKCFRSLAGILNELHLSRSLHGYCSTLGIKLHCCPLAAGGRGREAKQPVTLHLGFPAGVMVENWSF